MDKEKLRSIFWDYDTNLTGEDIYGFMVGIKEIEELNRDQVAARMLTSMRWYDLVEIFGIKRLYGFLNDDVLKFVWIKSLKNRYKNVRETLQGIL